MSVLLPSSLIFAEDFSNYVRVTAESLISFVTKFHLVWLLSLAIGPTLGKVVVLLAFFHFRIIEATVLL